MNPPKTARIRTLTLPLSALLALLTMLAPVSAYAAAPSNDNFADRTPVTALPFTSSQNTAEAGEEVGEPMPDCGYGVGKTVWYEYTPTTSGMVQVDTVGSDFDTVLGIWTGDSLATLTDVACDDDGAADVGSMAIFPASANTRYLIQVGGYDGESGPLSLRVGTPTSGSISGTVTSDLGEPLSNICIQARSESDYWGGWATTNSSGAYTMGGLTDGTYNVRFYDRCDGHRSHGSEWFDDQPTQATATGIVVTSPEAVTGIDAELSSLVLGSISGTVTSDTGEPLAGICVYAYDPEEDDTVGWTETDLSGGYSIDAPTGSYKVHFFDGCDERRDHASEYFDDQPMYWNATDVPVTGPEPTTGVDAELTRLGSISGTVTADTGEPVSPVCVDVYDAETGNWVGWTETDASGNYIAGVLAGTYHLTFYDCGGVGNYEREWFDDQPTRETATRVVVTGVDETAGIDAELATRVLGSISGTVTSNSGQPLPDICIDIFDSVTGGFAGWAYSTPSGTYSSMLRPGTYHVEFYDCRGQQNHRAEWFDDQPTRATATDVVVTANAVTSGIDAGLAPSSVAPQTTITSGPPGITTSTAAGFTFASSVAGSDFECSLDGSDFSTCTSPAAYSNLSDGSHTFRVRAVSPEGEVDPSPAHRNWVVDTSAPDLTILRPTGGAYVNDTSVGGTGPIVVVGSVRVHVLAMDPHSGVPAFSFEVDGIPLDPTAMTRQGHTYQFTYIPVTAGEHTIGLRATNGAGLQRSMTIDVIGVPDA